jgi:hypothetical protein
MPGRFECGGTTSTGDGIPLILAESVKRHQRELEERVKKRKARLVSIDPDGTLEDNAFVIVSHPTGVVYQSQCWGVGTYQLLSEGYLVPLNRSLDEHLKSTPTSVQLSSVFHQGSACVFDWYGKHLPGGRRRQLKRLVDSIPFWSNLKAEDSRGWLALDEDRVHPGSRWAGDRP